MATTATAQDRKVHVAKMGPTWVLSGQDGPHVVPMNLAIWKEEGGNMAAKLAGLWAAPNNPVPSAYQSP